MVDFYFRFRIYFPQYLSEGHWSIQFSTANKFILILLLCFSWHTFYWSNYCLCKVFLFKWVFVSLLTMPQCIVKSCKTTSGSKVKTHSVPSAKVDIALRKKWLIECGRTDLLFSDSKNIVCSKHFSSQCYVKNMRQELLNKRLQYDLIPGSIPTIFPVRIKYLLIIINNSKCDCF